MLQEIIFKFASVQVWIGLVISVIGGMAVGAIPGLSGGMAIALLLPVTYSMEPVAALVMLMAIYTSAMTGGSISAILLHTPGISANAATAMEGYPLTKQGRGLEAEVEKLTQAARYERNERRQGYRSGHYNHSLTTTSWDVTLKAPKLKGISFESAIIEWCRRRESSVAEALIEMYLAGVSARCVEDITEALWGSKVSPSTIRELNKKANVHIEDWRKRPPQGGRYPYVYVDGIYLRRNWGGEFENVVILVAIAVNEDG